MTTVFAAAGGADGMVRLAAAWHLRVMADEIVSHAFHGGARDDHTERLAAYWTEALGGPPDYTARFGNQSEVVRMHSGNGEHTEMDERAIACFDEAVCDVAITGRLRQVLHDYFTWATTTDMAAHPNSPDTVPDGLAIPRWSWDGLQT